MPDCPFQFGDQYRAARAFAFDPSQEPGTGRRPRHPENAAPENAVYDGHEAPAAEEGGAGPLPIRKGDGATMEAHSEQKLTNN